MEDLVFQNEFFDSLSMYLQSGRSCDMGRISQVKDTKTILELIPEIWFLEIMQVISH